MASLEGLFDGVNWAKVGLGIYGQRQAAQSNTRAAEISNEGALARIAAQREGAQLANERLQKISDAAAPDLASGSAHFRSIVAGNPNELSPAQVIGLEDARRAVVRSPVYRTSGRGTTAAIADVERRVRGGALETNQRRQDEAGKALIARGNQAVAAQTQQANVDLSTGRDAGAARQDASNTAAGAELATSQSMINVLGNIIAGEDKDRYKSRYRTTGAEI